MRYARDIETVGELMAVLAAYPPATTVRLALQPGYPVAVAVGRVVCTPDDATTDRGDPSAHERVVWISEGAPHCYLPVIARDALGGPWMTPA